MTAKEKIISELAKVQMNYLELYAKLSEKDLNKKSYNPGWKNGEVIFHMLFGYIIVLSLLPLAGMFGNLPKNLSKTFNNLLELFTPLFNWVNAIGARGGTKLLNKKRQVKTAEFIFNSLIKKAGSIKAADWHKGMYYPSKWDSLFGEYMTLEELFHYPTKHYNFHLKQIRYQ